MTNCSPGFTWLLDAIIIVAIVFNIRALARLQKAQGAVEDLLVKLRELWNEDRSRVPTR